VKIGLSFFVTSIFGWGDSDVADGGPGKKCLRGEGFGQCKMETRFPERKERVLRKGGAISVGA